MTSIYTLSCPVTNIVKYIGITRQKINIRYNEHIFGARKNGSKNIKESWIKSLLNEGIYPKMDVIDEVDDSDAKFFELFYIDLFNSWGFKLKNSHSYYNYKEYSKSNNSLKGTNISNEHKSKISEGLNRFYKSNKSKNLGKKRSEDLKLKISSNSRKKTLDKYNLNKMDIDNIKKEFIEYNIPLYKYAILKSMPYSFLYNLIVIKKYDLINE